MKPAANKTTRVKFDRESDAEKFWRATSDLFFATGQSRVDPATRCVRNELEYCKDGSFVVITETRRVR